MNRVFIKTYGCQMNVRDSEAVAAMLNERGYSIIKDEAQADIILLNTCSIREQAEQKAIGKAGHLGARKRKKNAKLIIGVIGCMAQNRGKDLLSQLPDLDLLIGTQKFHHIPDYLDEILRNMTSAMPQPTSIVDLEEEQGSQNTIQSHMPDNRQISAFVSIMQGCNMNCTYCCVPNTRGQERARSILDIVKEVQDLVSQGTREVTLLGQIVTSYGRREIPFLNEKSPFVQLLEAVNNIKGLQRIRFTSPHPRGFKNDLIQAYSYLDKLCEYVHLPLQSGSHKILKAMNRPYSPDRYREIAKDLRLIHKNMYISTDIIVGFPGETDEDFEQTRSFFEEMNYDMAYIFKYSERPRTEAENMKDDVPQTTKEARNQILLGILHSNSLKRNQSLVGTTEEVLVEKRARRGKDMYEGRTRGYRKVIFLGKDRLIGEMVKIKIEQVTASTLLGSLELKAVN